MIHDLPHDFLHSINPNFFLLDMQIPGFIQLLLYHFSKISSEIRKDGISGCRKNRSSNGTVF